MANIGLPRRGPRAYGGRGGAGERNAGARMKPPDRMRGPHARNEFALIANSQSARECREISVECFWDQAHIRRQVEDGRSIIFERRPKNGEIRRRKDVQVMYVTEGTRSAPTRIRSGPLIRRTFVWGAFRSCLRHGWASPRPMGALPIR